MTWLLFAAKKSRKPFIHATQWSFKPSKFRVAAIQFAEDRLTSITYISMSFQFARAALENAANRFSASS